MTPIYINFSRESERNRVCELDFQFPKQLVVFTNLLPIFEHAEVVVVDNMNKSNVNWTKRMLTHFIESGKPSMVKIDPDTIIRKFPEIPGECDVAGDFRYHHGKWIWLGGFQYFTRDAAIKILADEKYVGNCVFQDWALAESVRRQNLKAKVIQTINCWGIVPDKQSDVFHRGNINIARDELNLVEFNK
jgi:hypothetical protein